MLIQEKTKCSILSASDIAKMKRVLDSGKVLRTHLIDLSTFSDCLIRELRIAKLSAFEFSLDSLKVVLSGRLQKILLN